MLQGRLKGKKIILQYNFCIAEKEAWRVRLCCNTLECIAIEAAGLGWEFVLQYKNCIATVEQGQGWTVLQYSGQPSHDTVGAGQQARPQGRAGRAGRRRSAGLGVRGELGWAQQVWRAAGRARGRGARRQSSLATGTRQRRAGRAGLEQQGRGKRAAWALGARAGLGLCTRCTRPIFDPF